MKKYVCDVCGYVYDPEAGDPEKASSPELHSRTFPKIGYAPSAE